MVNANTNTNTMKTVFLTGATGSMGSATLLELLERRDRFTIVVLARDSKHGRKFLRPYLNDPGVRIVWGDLRDYESVLDGVNGADIVLHVAALVSPAADRDPELTRQINVGSIRNILKAIKAQPDPDSVRLVTVGSVAMTGSRLPPIHWGRVGDPINPAIGDHYAVSKIEAERLVVESGLRHWVSLRQTFICIPKLLSLMHPILFHQPLNTVFEFITSRDSGRLMANACEDDIPEDFWRRVYNIGGGEACRVGYVEYLNRIFGTLGLGKLSQLTERHWFALKNFHCQWYLDSDVLENYLHFRRDGLDEYVAYMAKSAPWYLRIGLGRIVLHAYLKGVVMKRLARGDEGPLHWVETDDHERVNAFFGSREAWENIPGWDEPIREPTPETAPPKPLDHGYDDSLPDAKVGHTEAVSAARFRGGECLSESMQEGDLFTLLQWRCGAGHEFEATPYLILRAGHWCQECKPPPWGAPRVANNRFLAQVAE
ncbi:MAG: NAD(P)-dependent oxidoreductase [Microbacteriaceae bacterium]|nr:NAD(P)-dependent oxidoreductase [Microbacteriaceae bacterium]